MVTVPKGLTEGYDTRGLPFGYDPHNFYEYQFEQFLNNSRGVEWMLYQYIPWSLIKTFALAIDPLSAFKVSPGVITPANRTKYRATASVLQTRKLVDVTNNTSYQQIVNYQGVGGCRSIGVQAVPPHYVATPYALNPQPALPDVLHDTTSRTRLMGSTQGTFDLFKGFAHSPPRSVSSEENFLVIPGAETAPATDQCIIRGGTYLVRSNGQNLRRFSIEGPAGVLSKTNHNTLRLNEIAYNTQLIANNVVSLLKGWSPGNRSYTLFRNVVELRDIPRSVSSLRTTVLNFRQLYVSLSTSPKLRKIIFDLRNTSKDIPGEYLSYHFGWKQLYKDVLDLAASPTKISKRINFLIERNGKPTTYRSKRNFVSGETGVSGFDYESFGIESSIELHSRIERSTELRLVINATFDFPNVDSPLFRLKEFTRRIGVVPTPTDLYNLIPWTWLLDWFTGLGNYIELIDNTNRDPTLVNWGVITAVSNGKLITERKSKTNVTDTITALGVVTAKTTQRQYTHTSVFDYVCEIRKDVSTSLGVNKTSDIASLTAYQKSILGALLAQRINFKRS
jgi:hypothetical protein